MRYPLPNGRIVVVPSILAADPARLGAEAEAAERAGADSLSVDIMDGRFVPNLSFGPAVVRAVRRRTRLPIDAHLMVDAPERILEAFVRSGADLVTVHLEACARPRAVLRKIRSLGARTGLAVRPRTSPERLIPYLDDLDLALVMTVEPGFGGQAFLRNMLPKLVRIRRAIGRRPVWLQVDGGIHPDTAALAAFAGADSLVAGTAVYRARSMSKAIARIRACAEQARRGTIRNKGN